jgi:hypothetical protein
MFRTFGFGLAFGLVFCFIASHVGIQSVEAQRISKSKRSSRGASSSASKPLSRFKRSSTDRSRRSRIGSRKRKLDPSDFMEAYYKLDSVTERGNEPLSFVASEYKWGQPGGLGTPITITYSFSNLLDGEIRGLSVDEIREATEEAFSTWANVAPLNFVEIADVGPDPTAREANYSTVGAADIRLGAHVMDGATGNELAHAYLPYSSSPGLAGDLHFDVDEDWGRSNGGLFLETMLHEIGHCLGVDHEEDVDAIMNPFIMNRFDGLGEAYLLDDDVDGIQAIYGVGLGGVTRLESPEESPEDEPNEEPTDDEPTDDEPTDDEPTDDEPTDELENNLVAEFDSESGLLMVQGDAMDNTIVVLGSRWGFLMLGGQDTTINGERAVGWRHSGDKSIEIVTSNGRDQVLMFGVSATTARVDLGVDDDGLVVLFSSIDSLDIAGGEGSNDIWKFFNRIGELIETGFDQETESD